MRKNIQKVIDAYLNHKAAKGDSKETCSTDGERIFSYSTLIAERLENGFTKVVAENGFSRTTKMQIRAVESELGRHCGHTECLEHEFMAVECPQNKRIKT